MGAGRATRVTRASGPLSSRVAVESLWAAAAAMVAFGVGAVSLRLWAWDPSRPLDLGWDHTQIAMQLKDIHDHGWYWHNGDIGYPSGQNGSWFPELNVIHIVFIKAIDLIVNNGFTAGSIYFLLSFPLTAVATYLLVRSQGLSRVAGFVAGVLLANTPGHAARFGHLYLAQYWVVPIALWLVLEVARGRPLLTPRGGGRSWWRGGRTLLTLAAIVLVGFSGVYYVAFTMVLLVCAALSRRIVGHSIDLFRGLALIAALGMAIAIPLGAARIGTAGDLVTGIVPAQRAPAESEIFAGKLMDLLLPWPDHIIPSLRFLSFVYNGTTRATVEVSALGIVGVAGLVGLTVVGLLALLVQRRLDPDLGRWSGLMLVSFMFYTVGGLGSFVAYFATAQVRTWSRLSLYILCFALLAVGWWLTRLERHRGRAVAGVVAVALTVVGVIDQVNPSVGPDHARVSAEMSGLETYTSALEDAVGDGCAVFQIPVLPYPETLGPARMHGYDQLKPYLAGSSLKFSFGAMRGTAAADWMLAVDTDDVRQLAASLRSVGFCALEVDTRGFTAQHDPTGTIQETLGSPVAMTPDGTFVAYDLRSAGDTGDTAMRERTLHPLVAAVRGYDPDVVNDRLGQYVAPVGGMTISNLGNTPREVTIRLTIEGVGEEARRVVLLDGEHQVASATISEAAPAVLTVARTASAGVSTLKMTVSGSTDKIPGDDRVTVARVTDLEVSAGDGVRAVSLLDQARSGWVVP
jgi:hypothetical protein